MTAISPTRDYFTVYPCASGRPETSNLNTRPGIPTPNLVVAIPDANREICIFSHGTAHLIIDLAGWWSDGPDRFASIQPTRVYDTRQPGGARLARFVTREVKIPTSVIPDGSTAAVVNLTVDRAAAAGYLTAFPCGQPAPPSSNLNFVARRGAGGRGDRRARARQHDVRADRHCRRRDRRRHGLLRAGAEFRADRATAAAQWHAHRRHPQRHRRPARPVRGRRDPGVRSGRPRAGRQRGFGGHAQRDRRQPAGERVSDDLPVFAEPPRGVVAQLHGSR